MKNKKEKKPEFIIGKRVREIQIDKTQHVFELSFAVAIFAMLLLGGAISLGAMVQKWYVWLICGMLLVYFITHSVVLVVRAATHPKYLICNNCLVLNSIWHYGIIELDKITKIEKKKTRFDKIQKKEMNSLTIYYQDEGRRKMTMHCITENLDDVVNAIDKQIKSYKNELQIINKEKSE